MSQHPKYYQNTPTQPQFFEKDGYKSTQETKTLKKIKITEMLIHTGLILSLLKTTGS